ncbi:dual OB domain-containing protein [Planomonospora parontospora]|uniref:dual OB domain-containing protein n=1 Tax=Planomonospora parontospora TaxID=58119 RepID=UPI00166FE881|nr:hypothetical protein [Planomonospora parontospora]GGL57852.1 hypothetical protein GCM10014719_69100 [Planomonospora parontospora subsp. antibiotica]GII20085.1 hypothetical protein Ppa05_68110 [Planomonospora parontospora subsp. antibiotica]
MTTVKTLVCLANSRKNWGRCVAGIVEGGQEWVRPVSDRQHGEVSLEDQRYEDGSDPRVLDIISVPLLQPQPHDYQRENWLLDPGYYWMNVGRVGWDELLTLEQRPESLWVNGYSTYRGGNDRVPIAQTVTLKDSLKLIRVGRLRLQVHTSGAAPDNTRRAVSARFMYAGSTYILRVTDPEYEREYLAKADGGYELGESFITVSLGEPYKEYAYKLVAAIIERAKIETGSRT